MKKKSFNKHKKSVKKNKKVIINEEYINKRTFLTKFDNVLTVSIYANFYPIAYKTSNGEFKGLDVDIIVLFSKAAGLKLNFIERPHFDKIWFDPEKGKSDIAIGGIGMTPERLSPETEWSMPYFHVLRTLVYNKLSPIHKFPNDVTGTVLGTYNSTGWLDAQLRSKPLHKDHLMHRGTTDEEDIKKLKNGEIQGIMRGSFVGQSIVKRYPKNLKMVKPWEIDPTLVTSDGEIFAFPTRLGSGVAVGISSFLTELLLSGKLQKLIIKKISFGIKKLPFALIT